jgi:hypothetical protein
MERLLMILNSLEMISIQLTFIKDNQPINEDTKKLLENILKKSLKAMAQLSSYISDALNSGKDLEVPTDG